LAARGPGGRAVHRARLHRDRQLAAGRPAPRSARHLTVRPAVAARLLLAAFYFYSCRDSRSRRRCVPICCWSPPTRPRRSRARSPHRSRSIRCSCWSAPTWSAAPAATRWSATGAGRRPARRGRPAPEHRL